MVNTAIPQFSYRSPIYRVPDGFENDLRQYLSLIPDSKERSVLMTIIINAATYGLIEDTDQGISYLLDTQQLNALIEANNPLRIGVGRTATHKRVKRFCTLGFFERSKLPNHANRGPVRKAPRYVYTLQPLHDVLAAAPDVDDAPIYAAKHARDEQYHQVLSRSKDRLISGDAQLLEAPRDLRHANSERLLNNVFFSCGRQSYRDSRRDRIETTYFFKKEKVKITSTSGGGVPLFTLEDQSTVLAIITLVIFYNQERMRAGKELKNEYYVDIVSLCKVCGLPNPSSGGNRQTIRESLDRLYHSNINVQCPPESEFAAFFGLDSDTDDGSAFNPDNMDFRFLSDKSSVSSVEGELSRYRRPRYYRLSLHPLIFQQLTDPDTWNTFIVNPQLLKDRLKNITHLYFFVSRTIARDPTINRSWPLKTVQKMIMPAYSHYSNWERSLFNDLQKFATRNEQTWSPDEECVINLYGYFVKFTPCKRHGHVITCWFDKNDPILSAIEPSAESYSQYQLDLIGA